MISYGASQLLPYPAFIDRIDRSVPPQRIAAAGDASPFFGLGGEVILSPVNRARIHGRRPESKRRSSGQPRLTATVRELSVAVEADLKVRLYASEF
jgi:hypothetical protein